MRTSKNNYKFCFVVAVVFGFFLIVSRARIIISLFVLFVDRPFIRNIGFAELKSRNKFNLNKRKFFNRIDGYIRSERFEKL